MHSSVIFLFVACSVLAMTNAGRNFGLQEQGNIWNEKLVGKKIILAADSVDNFDPETEYKESDLPSPYRIIRPGSFETYDYRSDRLNVNVDSSNIVQSVNFA